MGCGPCDGFSPAGSGGGFNHPLSGLMERLLNELELPNIRFWVTEHVKELCYMQDGAPPGIVYVVQRLESLVSHTQRPSRLVVETLTRAAQGYNYAWRHLDSLDLGSAARRKRFFMVAVRNNTGLSAADLLLSRSFTCVGACELLYGARCARCAPPPVAEDKRLALVQSLRLRGTALALQHAAACEESRSYAEYMLRGCCIELGEARNVAGSNVSTIRPSACRLCVLTRDGVLYLLSTVMLERLLGMADGATFAAGDGPGGFSRSAEGAGAGIRAGSQHVVGESVHVEAARRIWEALAWPQEYRLPAGVEGEPFDTARTWPASGYGGKPLRSGSVAPPRSAVSFVSPAWDYVPGVSITAFVDACAADGVFPAGRLSAAAACAFLARPLVPELLASPFFPPPIHAALFDLASPSPDAGVSFPPPLTPLLLSASAAVPGGLLQLRSACGVCTGCAARAPSDCLAAQIRAKAVEGGHTGALLSLLRSRVVGADVLVWHSGVKDAFRAARITAFDQTTCQHTLRYTLVEHQGDDGLFLLARLGVRLAAPETLGELIAAGEGAERIAFASAVAAAERRAALRLQRQAAAPPLAAHGGRRGWLL
jgi:site-specific DNA-cytosine methylase